MDRLKCCFISVFIWTVAVISTSHAETDFDYDSSTRILTVNVDFPLELNYRRLNISTETNFKVHLDQSLLPASNSSSCHDLLVNQELTSIRTKRVCVNNTNNFNSNKWIHCDLDQSRVEFKNVYSGFYCIRFEIYDKDNSQSARHITDNPVQLQTDVVEQDIFRWNVSVEFSSIGQQDLSVEIQLEEPFILDFDRYYVDLFRMEDVNGSVIPFLHNGWSWTDHPIYDYVTINASYLVRANNNNSLNHSKIRVDFYNCSHGTYCVVVVPADGRCHAIWLDEKLGKRTCERHSNIVRLIEGKLIVGNPLESITLEGDQSIWWSAGLVFAFLLVLSLVIFMLYRHLKPHPYNSDLIEDLESEGAPFVSGSLLLLYSQQNERIVRKVRKMKDHLGSKYMIYDDFGDDESVALGTEWFHDILYDTSLDVTVVVISSPEMIRCQQFLYRQPSIQAKVAHFEVDFELESLDRQCLHRLNTLLYYLANFQDSYHKVFVIELEDEMSSSLKLVTPYRSYHWPISE